MQINQLLEQYISQHSLQEPAYLTDLAHRTGVHVINPRMMCGAYEGRLLYLLVKLTKARRIIELGTFSGYSALSMAEALPDDGIIDTIEIDDEKESFINSELARVEHGKKVHLHIGDAVDIIPTLVGDYDLAFIDADKRLYKEYLDLLLPKMKNGALILADNTLWDGKVVEQIKESDRQSVGILLFNDYVAAHPQLESILLPLRDGLTLIYVKK